MVEIVKPTIATQNKKTGTITKVPVVEGVTPTQTISRLVYFLLGVLEVLLVFRLFFKLAGASVSSSFVAFIYNVTRIFIYPFEGIFHKVVSEGVETASVLEPSSVVAIVVYALVAWGIVKLIVVLSQQEDNS